MARSLPLPAVGRSPAEPRSSGEMGLATSWVSIFFLFLGSATAVPLAGPLRLSDFAFLVPAALGVPAAARAVVRDGNPLRTGIAIALVLIASTLLSWVAQLVTGDWTTIEGGAPTAVQVPLAILVAIVLILAVQDALVRTLARISFAFSIILVLVLVAHLLLPQPGWLIIDYETTDRFSALSANPNQLQLVLLPLPFFSYIAWRQDKKSGLIAALEIVAIFVVNLFTFGKTLFIAWMFCLAPILYIDMVLRDQALRLILIPLAFIAVPLAFIGGITVVADFYSGNARGSIAGQGEDRLALWRHGLEAWADAPALGHGPGPFSGIFSPYEGIEAHNTFVDWGASYGAVGFLLLVAFYGYAFRSAFKRRNLIALGLFTAVAVQAFTGFVGRSPYLWFWYFCALGYVGRQAGVVTGWLGLPQAAPLPVTEQGRLGQRLPNTDGRQLGPLR